MKDHFSVAALITFALPFVAADVDPKAKSDSNDIYVIPKKGQSKTTLVSEGTCESNVCPANSNCYDIGDDKSSCECEELYYTDFDQDDNQVCHSYLTVSCEAKAMVLNIRKNFFKKYKIKHEDFSFTDCATPTISKRVDDGASMYAFGLDESCGTTESSTDKKMVYQNTLEYSYESRIAGDKSLYISRNHRNVEFKCF